MQSAAARRPRFSGLEALETRRFADGETCARRYYKGVGALFQ
jgi:hypothetical protein